MSLRNFNNVTTIGALTGPIASSATSATVSGLSNPPPVPFTATIDRNTPSEEICLVTAIAGTTLTLTRGYDGTAGQAHTAGATIEHTAGAIEYTEANGHTNATSNVHGSTGTVVGNQGAQTIYDKTLVSPVMQADTTKGDACVAYTPPGTTTKNLYSGTGADGLTKFTVDSSGNVTGAGVGLTALNATVAAQATTLAAKADKTYVDSQDALKAAKTYVDSQDATKAAKTYVDSQDTATLASAKSYTDAQFTDGGWKTISLSNGFAIGGLGAQYRVRNGFCYFSFDLTRSSAWAANIVAAIFPVGARPTQVPHYAHTLLQSIGVVSSTVGTDGTLTITASGGANADLFVSGFFPIN